MGNIISEVLLSAHLFESVLRLKVLKSCCNDDDLKRRLQSSSFGVGLGRDWEILLIWHEYRYVSVKLTRENKHHEDMMSTCGNVSLLSFSFG